MREILARRIALLAGTLVVALAVLFAHLQNPPAGRPPAPGPAMGAPAAPRPELPAAAAPGSPLAARGEQLYADLACARCHSIAGRGNPRVPLDGIGTRADEAAIRSWITPGAAQPATYQERHADLGLGAGERDALAAYLLGLRN